MKIVNDDTNPLITSIITTYRRPLLVQRAILSALNQIEKRVRVLVLDDASGDDTEKVVRELMQRDDRIVYHRHNPNIGLVANFDYGLQHITTPYFSFLSDDDALLPECYAEALRQFAQCPAAMFAVFGTAAVSDTGAIMGMSILRWKPGFYEPPTGIEAMVTYGVPIWTGIVFRREIYSEIGGLDPEVGIGMDRDFELRAAARFPFVVCHTPGAIFRVETLKPNGARHPYPFHGIWPGRPKMMEKLGRNEFIPPAIRTRVTQILENQFRRNLPGLGLRYIYTGQLESAIEVANVLATHYRSPVIARIIRAVLALRKVGGTTLTNALLGLAYRFNGLSRAWRQRITAQEPYANTARAIVEYYRAQRNIGT